MCSSIQMGSQTSVTKLQDTQHTHGGGGGGGDTQNQKTLLDVSSTWVAKSASWYMNEP